MTDILCVSKYQYEKLCTFKRNIDIIAVCICSFIAIELIKVALQAPSNFLAISFRLVFIRASIIASIYFAESISVFSFRIDYFNRSLLLV